jgi:hypothetical protein
VNPARRRALRFRGTPLWSQDPSIEVLATKALNRLLNRGSSNLDDVLHC